MKAIADRYSVHEAAVQAIRAGCDTLLVCHQAERVQASADAIERARRDGSLPEARFHEALRRTQALTARPAMTGAYVPAPGPSGELAVWLAACEKARLVDPTEASA